MSKIKRSKIKKIRGRESISVGTWDVRTLRSAGKLEELTHAMSRYHWNMLGPARCAGKTMVRCQQMMDTRFISVEKSSDMSMVLDFLCIRILSAVLGCRPVFSRLISIRLRAAPFNITIIQIYAPTSGHDDSEVDHLYQQHQKTIVQTP